METKEILKIFIEEFIPEGRGFSGRMSADIKTFVDVISKVFKKKFEIELPKNPFFFIDAMGEIPFPIKYVSGDETFFRKQWSDDENFGMYPNIRVKCTGKVLRELRSALYEYPKAKEESKAKDKEILRRLELFKEKILNDEF